MGRESTWAARGGDRSAGDGSLRLRQIETLVERAPHDCALDRAAERRDRSKIVDRAHPARRKHRFAGVHGERPDAVEVGSDGIAAHVREHEPGDIQALEPLERVPQREIVIRPGGRELRFVAQDYIRGFVLPNFYFHLTTAYGILRHCGVELGKQDYLGKIPMERF